MSLREVDGLPGPPWERALAGTLDKLVVESDLLTGNPLGDPARRPLYVYRPPGVGVDQAERVPAVYAIQGFTGQLDGWLARSPFEPSFPERLDEYWVEHDVPDAIVVFVDCWTRRGGSQFLNSASTGQYMDYLCDEVVAFVDSRYPTIGDRDHRALAGKSSGGYGAMVVPMMRPDVWGALASHAGDALWEASLLPDFPAIARDLRDNYEGSYEKFFEVLAEQPRFDWAKFGKPFEIYGYAVAYTPDPDRPGEAILPFELDTGRLREDVWAKWLELDPVRMAPKHADALRSMNRIYLDAGRADEWYLDLGATAFAKELDAIGASYTLDLFDAGHMGIAYRYPGAIHELVKALSP
jgi:hypothetical protein